MVIPAKPSNTYADWGWAGYGDWLGTGNIGPSLRVYRSFKEARLFANQLGLKNKDEWLTYSKGHMPEMGTLPSDIPADPRYGYADKGWSGYGDWLGTGRTRVSKSTKLKA